MSVDILITTTEDWTLDFTIVDTDGDVVTDLIGATGELQIKGRLLDSIPLVTAVAVINAQDSVVQFTVSDTVVASLLADGDVRRSMVYEVKISYADGLDYVPFSGRLKLTRGVIR
jgi:hypothetical protein